MGGAAMSRVMRLLVALALIVALCSPITLASSLLEIWNATEVTLTANVYYWWDELRWISCAEKTISPGETWNFTTDDGCWDVSTYWVNISDPDRDRLYTWDNGTRWVCIPDKYYYSQCWEYDYLRNRDQLPNY